MSIATWFPEWLRSRIKVRGEQAGELTWRGVIDEFSNDGAALLYILLTVAHGRPVFEANVSDLLCLIAMERERFDELVREFVAHGVLAMGATGEWQILRTPQGWDE
jgi:hypothetical protein